MTGPGRHAPDCFMKFFEGENETVKKLTSLILTLAMVLSLAACGAPAANQSEAPVNSDAPAQSQDVTPVSTEPKYGGNLTVYFQEFYNDYDPSVADMRNYNLWYEPLFGIDWARADSGEIYTSEYLTMDWMTGQIADSYTFENGDLTVKLREDVFFQDKEPYNGRQLVAEDVKWSYDRLLGTGSGFDAPYECMSPWSMLLSMVESIDTDGDYTVIFHFNTDSELALNTFMINQVMIAGHEWDELTAEQKADWHYAAGTGPYILEEYVPDSHMKLVKNENYYDYDERYPENKLPYLDSITLQLVADSTQVQTQFMAGNIDVVAWGGNVLTKTEAEMLEESMADGSYARYDFISAPPGIGLKLTNPALADINVRKALQMAVNSEEIYAEYFGYEDKDLNMPGLFALVTQYSDAENFSQELHDSYYKYDPEGAKKLMAEAGYADGFTFDVTIFGALDADLFALVADYLKQNLNVTMNISIANSPPEMQQIGKDLTNQVSIFVSGGQSRTAQVAAYFTTDGTENSTAVSDPVFDKMVEDFNNATSMEEAEKLGKELDRYWAEQHWCLYLGGAEVISTFISGRVGGYTGERLFKNWNANQILPRIWVND